LECILFARIMHSTDVCNLYLLINTSRVYDVPSPCASHRVIVHCVAPDMHPRIDPHYSTAYPTPHPARASAPNRAHRTTIRNTPRTYREMSAAPDKIAKDVLVRRMNIGSQFNKLTVDQKLHAHHVSQ
jgi:hypothetical protein